jgi:linoleoyl-CoA desaturase
LNYILLGLSGLLLAFNCSHDCVHNTFSNNKKLNSVIYYVTFNLQGVNSRLWKKRHIASHHLFPNVDGCDADIDNNPFIRLSESHKKKAIHKYQHIYASVLYCLYTLHWILIKDIIYLSKKELANLKNQTYSTMFIIELILLKVFYFSYLIIIPYILTDIPLPTIITGFFLMHFVISIFFVLTLIISHLTTETKFPKIDSDGFLPYDYYEHQLAVSLDYHPSNKIANWIFGGFNSHSAHHLFPKLPHTTYHLISPTIKSLATKHKLPYNEMNIIEAVISHYQYLKRLGQ